MSVSTRSSDLHPYQNLREKCREVFLQLCGEVLFSEAILCIIILGGVIQDTDFVIEKGLLDHLHPFSGGVEINRKWCEKIRYLEQCNRERKETSIPQEAEELDARYEWYSRWKTFCARLSLVFLPPGLVVYHLVTLPTRMGISSRIWNQEVILENGKSERLGNLYQAENGKITIHRGKEWTLHRVLETCNCGLVGCEEETLGYLLLAEEVVEAMEAVNFCYINNNHQFGGIH